MARANRHFIPGLIWHITHRCHNKEFLLKLKRDRRLWLRWLYEAKKRFNLCILDYMVTSNHIHLLVWDNGPRDVIPKSIHLIAGQTAQNYNRRKNRKGAYWEDRYHATAVDSDSHFLRCVVYIDLNMVRAGVVNHPLEWPFCGFYEVQNIPRRRSLIQYGALMRLFETEDLQSLQRKHRELIAETLKKNVLTRQPQWTESIAVGRREFVERIKTRLGVKAKGRETIDSLVGYELREGESSDYPIFGLKNEDLSPENRFKWNVTP